MIISLMFIRNVLSPLLLAKGNFSSVIHVENGSDYINNSIFLLIYEMLSVFFVIIYCKRRETSLEKNTITINIASKKIEQKYVVIIIVALIVLLLCYKISPQFMFNYRTIYEMTSENSANYEDYMINRKYGTSTIKLLGLVIGNYIMRVVLLIIPSVLIILLRKVKNRPYLSKMLSFLVCFIPMMFIGGAIARSLIYFICLLMLRNQLFYEEKFTKKSIFLLFLGVAVILFWWSFRSYSIDTNDIWVEYSARINAYFSGVATVSGVYNLPNSMEYRIKYFFTDILSSIPFGNTIFGLDGSTSQEFFNNYNSSSGQIPPTIGMGYYYFGFVFSPLYSIIFTVLSFKNSEKLRYHSVYSPFEYIRCLYSIFVFSMGIVMYSIEITLTNTFCIIFPIYIMELLSISKGEKNE